MEFLAQTGTSKLPGVLRRDFLHHLIKMLRCDILVWILAVKLSPLYYQKLNLLLSATVNYRHVGSECTWEKLEHTLITLSMMRTVDPPQTRHALLQIFGLDSSFWCRDFICYYSCSLCYDDTLVTYWYHGICSEIANR